jgi:hypothetical protein
MRDHDKLSLLAQFGEHLSKATYVGLIQHRINLVQHAKGRRTDLDQGEYQGSCSQAPLTPREQGEALLSSVRGARHDFHAALDGFLGVGQDEAGGAAAKQPCEGPGELGRHCVERLPKVLLHHRVQLGNHLAQLGIGFPQIADLADQEPMALSELSILGRSVGVDGSHAPELLLAPLDRVLQVGRKLCHDGQVPHHLAQRQRRLPFHVIVQRKRDQTQFVPDAETQVLHLVLGSVQRQIGMVGNLLRTANLASKPVLICQHLVQGVLDFGQSCIGGRDSLAHIRDRLRQGAVFMTLPFDLD